MADLMDEYLVIPEEFANTKIGHKLMRYTFHIVTQISTSRELNRVSPNNISEMSTRYVNLKDGAICRPYWMTDEEMQHINYVYEHQDISPDTADEDYEKIIKILNTIPEPAFAYSKWCDSAFNGYQYLQDRCDFKKQDARGVLPLDTATEVVYTYSIEEWKRIIALRTSPRAHPNCAIVMNMVKQQLEELGYDF